MIEASKPIRDIVIVGGGTAGWTSAALLAKRLQTDRYRITLVESDQISTVGVGEATIPPIVGFNKILGLDESAFIRATMATFKLGIEFVDWGRQGEAYIHPFAKYGTAFAQEPFHHYWLKLWREGKARALQNYSLPSLAAYAGKFMHSVKRPGSPLSAIGYAYHLDAGLYAAHLRQYAERLGVVREEGKVVRTRQRENGDIESVELESGMRIRGDLFIDCSGFRGLLIGGALDVGYTSWQKWLPCDRAVTVASEHQGELLPVTRAKAHNAGWQWRIPLQHRVGNGHVYASAYMSDGEAEQLLLDHIDGAPQAQPRVLEFTPGRRDCFWKNNCVAIGLSSGFLEPLESTSIHLIHLGLYKLLELLPSEAGYERAASVYNRMMAEKFEQVRDFIILHYKATQRDDSAFWNYCRTMEIPDKLAEKIALYEEGGVIFRENDELFSENSWLAVLHGQGIEARNYHPLVDTMPTAQAEQFLQQIESKVQEGLAEMPDHKEYLARHCGVVFGG